MRLHLFVQRLHFFYLIMLYDFIYKQFFLVNQMNSALSFLICFFKISFNIIPPFLLYLFQQQLLYAYLTSMRVLNAPVISSIFWPYWYYLAHFTHHLAVHYAVFFIIFVLKEPQPIPVATWLRRVSVAAHSLEWRVRIPRGTSMSLSRRCCVLSGRSLCYGLIRRPEEYNQMCVCVIESDQM